MADDKAYRKGEAADLPEFAPATQSMHELIRDPAVVFLIQWRNPDMCDKWMLYGRVYDANNTSLTCSLSGLRHHRNKNNDPHEYRIVAYRPVGVVKE